MKKFKDMFSCILIHLLKIMLGLLLVLLLVMLYFKEDVLIFKLSLYPALLIVIILSFISFGLFSIISNEVKRILDIQQKILKKLDELKYKQNSRD